MRWTQKRARSKERALDKHAQRRAYERFGVSLSPGELAHIIKAINSGEAWFIERQSNRVTVWAVRLPNGELARACYDGQRHQIITFLPRAEV